MPRKKEEKAPGIIPTDCPNDDHEEVIEPLQTPADNNQESERQDRPPTDNDNSGRLPRRLYSQRLRQAPSGTKRTLASALKDEEQARSTPTSSIRSSMVSHSSEVWSETAEVKSVLDHDVPAVAGRTKAPALSIVPEIDCRVAVYLCEELLEHPENLRISWLREGQYEYVKKTVRRLLQKHVEKKGYTKRPNIYRTSAEVKLFKRTTKDLFQLGSDTVQHPDHWAERVPILVAKHGSENPFATLHLEVIWRFDMIDIHGQDGKTLAHKIWKAVHSKLVYNWREEPFLPKTDLDAIFSEEIIRELINKDESLSQDGPWSKNAKSADYRKQLTQEVFLNASLLLAICIYAERPLSCLYHLIIGSKMRDTELPLKTAPEGFSDRDLHFLKSTQKTFLVYNFNEAKLQEKMQRGEYEVIPYWQVVPITAKGELGKGGYGFVKEVNIHSDHHNFKENVFALKQLNAVPAVSRAFVKEHHVFSNLMGVQHNNILLPLAMWRQQDAGSDDRFYMLYPKAQCNLKEHLRKDRKLPRLEKKFVEHLVLQLRNLADALESIHLLRKRSGLMEEEPKQSDFSGVPNESASSSLHPSAAEKKPRKAAYHHDLKPENILVFDDGTWKISDFGTAGVIQAISGGSIFDVTEIQSGDPIYSPPDHAMKNRTARPYDVWCFGCILLEILLTIFEEGTADQLDEFPSKSPEPHRLDKFYCDRADSVDGVAVAGLFWYQRDDGQFDLRKPVKERLATLHRRTKDYDQFDALVQLAEDMLSIHASKRPSAEKVSARMRKIYVQVTHNLKTNEDFYAIPGSLAQPYASRPTTDAGSHGSSLTIDDKIPHEWSSTHTRHLSLPELRRNRRHSAPNSSLARLDIAGGPANYPDSNYQTEVDGTATTPTVRVHYADRISLASSNDEAVPAEEAQRESSGEG
ncbi:uncharacterized protein Z518_01476 [Rhinocladiella mackenziei CBS 650.93]|uniref:Protein kinase domain-containing protein n=1 Tax=Rhinocladiella mackenziei CBS 650.93 TaxID=1442369 RepID=A0A0D2IWL7_9EURO|nr:uncharacterized protein Z518_01476 [Rhinocladiella mackenziei CBS 650.93]KIX10394.1 hypothetical protein Z518_01476 [Rhinocladiella mackenziei CBS 650.93]